MSQTNPSQDPLEPKFEIEMLGEGSMSFREFAGILTPRWVKRLFRRRRSS